MSDSLYVAPEAGAGAGTGSGALLGMNSGRHPDEPQPVVLVAARGASDSITVDGKRFDAPDRGYAFVISRPAWAEGGEMGMNDRGVAIALQAVFSRFKPAKDGVLGMSMLRAALMTAGSAKEALEFLYGQVEKQAQGGNSVFWGTLLHDSSFMIADGVEAFVLETAGSRWAWRPAERRDALSNAYCITEDYKRLDVQTRKEIAPVNERAACSDEADPGRKGEKESWRAHVEDKGATRAWKGDVRRALALKALGAGVGGAFGAAGGQGAAGVAGGTAPGAPVLAMFSILRSHGEYDPAKPLSRHKESLCMHPGGIPRLATTGSMVVEWRAGDGSGDGGGAILWYTNGSMPCLSLYRPMLLAGGKVHSLCEGSAPEEGSGKSEEAWKRQHDWAAGHHTLLKGSSLHADASFVAKRDAAQAELAMIASKAMADLAAGAGSGAGGATEARALEVLRREAGAIVAGWEKDLGLR